jgi:hypothetical protein
VALISIRAFNEALHPIPRESILESYGSFVETTRFHTGRVIRVASDRNSAPTDFRKVPKPAAGVEPPHSVISVVRRGNDRSIFVGTR